ncbi:hypothetical protein QBC33DRAFT_576986 [Phialemonium atrogriseum]|uniref:Aminoglycoside phosphotransferase domain-containing protein n=1 Tax=Phialemonium atrogriseum TaxID=1093897 RepID=A0AAJ0C5N8_9PEZI|nr:uncharacterized protein QBC33DRAFT_576986 [Phialemonium atrogriseum]KAK1769192.1 hypothetical protein QBC33DRAFT_576986 [Phialemonium atrogriseum]
MEPPRLISMEVSTSGRSDCYFRILANRSVKYITIKAGALDAESLDDMPLDFQNILPPLPYQEDTWKSACITRNPSSLQLEATLSSADLPSEIQYMEAETRMYQVLEGRGIAPKFLGHIHEAGRADLEICEAALRRFHALGFVHGDCNKYNFIIRPDGQVVLIDFDKAKTCADPALMEAEIASLEGQLAETTGRGGGLYLHQSQQHMSYRMHDD